MSEWTCWRGCRPLTAVGTHRFGWPFCQVCGAGPPYHERAAYAANVALDVYVPTTTAEPSWARTFIAPGSAIVGVPDGGAVVTYFEGWVYGGHRDMTLRQRWELGLRTAADRMITDYPTIAQARVLADELAPVASYRVGGGVTVHDETALAAWLGEPA